MQNAMFTVNNSLSLQYGNLSQQLSVQNKADVQTANIDTYLMECQEVRCVFTHLKSVNIC